MMATAEGARAGDGGQLGRRGGGRHEKRSPLGTQALT